MSGSVLVSRFFGTGSSITNINASNITSGILPLSRGGTGLSAVSKDTILVGNTAGTALTPALGLKYDSANLFLGVNKSTAPTTALDVSGTVTATLFSGSGANLTNLDAVKITQGILAATRGGTGISLSASNKDDVLVGDAAGTALTPATYLKYDSTAGSLAVGKSTVAAVGSVLDVSGKVTATSFEGDGASLTNLDAAKVASGILAPAYGGTGRSSLAKDVLYVGADDGTQLVPAVGLKYDSASSWLAVNKSTAPTTALDVSGTVTATAFQGDGAALTALDTANVSTGILPVTRGGTGLGTIPENAILVGDSATSLAIATGFHYDEATQSLAINKGSVASVGVTLDVSGVVSATSFVGDGSEVTNLSVASLNTATGLLPVSKGGTGLDTIPANAILIGDTSASLTTAVGLVYDNTAQTLAIAKSSVESGVTLDVSGTVSATAFKGSGALLTGLDTANVSTGILPVTRGGTGLGAVAKDAILVGDSETALSVAAGLKYDASAGSLAINKETTATTGVALEVVGTLSATAFVGDGSGVTNLSVSNIDGVLPVTKGGTGLSSLATNAIVIGGSESTLSTAVGLVYDDTAKTLAIAKSSVASGVTLDVSGVVKAVSLQGDGSAITDLDTAKITTGTLSVARGGTGLTAIPKDAILVGDSATALAVATGIKYDDAAKTLAIAKDSVTAGVTLDVSGTVAATKFVGDASDVTNLSVVNIDTANGYLPVSKGGTGLGSVSANAILVGDTSSALTVATGLAYDNAAKTLAIAKSSVDSGVTLDVSGTVAATAFKGDGSQLTNLASSNISGIVPVSKGGTGLGAVTKDDILVGNDDGTALTPAVGIKYDSTLKTLAINKTSAASGTTLDVSGRITATSLAGDGSLLSALNATNISTGIMSVARGGTGLASVAKDAVLVGGGGSNPMAVADALKYDSTNLRLGISKVPTATLDVSGSLAVSGTLDASVSAAKLGTLSIAGKAFGPQGFTTVDSSWYGSRGDYYPKSVLMYYGTDASQVVTGSDVSLVDATSRGSDMVLAGFAATSNGVTANRTDSNAITRAHSLYMPTTTSVDLTARLAEITALKNVTVSLWLKLDAVSQVQTIVSIDNSAAASSTSFDLDVAANGSVSFYMRCGGSTMFRVDTPAASLVANRWTHLVATCGASGPAVYVNKTKYDTLFSTVDEAWVSRNTTACLAANADWNKFGIGCDFVSSGNLNYMTGGYISDFMVLDYQIDQSLVDSVWADDYGYCVVPLLGEVGVIGRADTAGATDTDWTTTTLNGRVFQLPYDVNGDADGNVTTSTITAASTPLDFPSTIPSGGTWPDVSGEVAGKAGPYKAFAEGILPYIRGQKRRLLFVPVAKGGTGFATNDWNKGNKMYNAAVNATSRALAKHPLNTLLGIVWSQGQTDYHSYTYNQTDASGNAYRLVNSIMTDRGNTYTNNLANMFEDMAADLRRCVWRMPVVMVGVRYGQYFANQVDRNYAATHANHVAYVDTDSLATNGASGNDASLFSVASLRTIGSTCATQMRSILTTVQTPFSVEKLAPRAAAQPYFLEQLSSDYEGFGKVVTNISPTYSCRLVFGRTSTSTALTLSPGQTTSLVWLNDTWNLA